MGTDRLYRFLFAGFLFLISLISLAFVLGWTIPLDYLNNERRLIVAIIAVAGLALACLVFKKGFRKRIVKEAEVIETTFGKIKIGIDVLENMANRVAGQIQGIKSSKTHLKPLVDGVAVYVKIGLAPDINIPEITAALQNDIYEYFKNIVGIEVKEVSVLVVDFAQENKNRVA